MCDSDGETRHGAVPSRGITWLLLPSVQPPPGPSAGSTEDDIYEASTKQNLLKCHCWQQLRLPGLLPASPSQPGHMWERSLLPPQPRGRLLPTRHGAAAQRWAALARLPVSVLLSCIWVRIEHLPLSPAAKKKIYLGAMRGLQPGFWSATMPFYTRVTVGLS